MSVLQLARLREGNVGGEPADVVSLADSPRRLPTDANRDFVGAPDVQS
jgi:hypothetical protein